MTSTDIQFNKKQKFINIKSVIEKEFDNVFIDNSFNTSENSNIYISFNYKGQYIYCYFCENNICYGKNNIKTEYSSLGSDRPNDIKTEAFKIIAQYFDCVFWENDCSEDNFIKFTRTKKIPKLEYPIGYKSETQTNKNIAWFLPRPKKDRYKGGMPLYCENWLIDLATDILYPNKDLHLLNVFCGMNQRGFRVDMKEEVKPDLICDIHKLSEYLKPVHPRFNIIIADPPYSTEEAKEIYGTPPLKYKTWTSECDKYLKVGGLFMIYHKYIVPNPDPKKYEVVKRVFIGNRTMHLPRVCVVFKKKH